MATANQATNGTQVPAGAAGHNSAALDEANLKAWLDASKEWGDAAGAGDTSKVGWFQDMVQRAFRDEIKPDWAEKGYDAFIAARRAKAAALGKRAGQSDTSKGVRVSEARKMIKLGGLPTIRDTDGGGLGVFNRAVQVIGKDPELKGEVDKMLLKVATEQLSKPDVPLDADHIRQVLSPKETEDKGEGEYLNIARKNIELAVKKSSWDPHKRAAMNSINARTEQIGFKTAGERRLEAMEAAKLKKEKMQQKAAASAKKKR